MFSLLSTLFNHIYTLYHKSTSRPFQKNLLTHLVLNITSADAASMPSVPLAISWMGVLFNTQTLIQNPWRRLFLYEIRQYVYPNFRPLSAYLPFILPNVKLIYIWNSSKPHLTPPPPMKIWNAINYNSRFENMPPPLIFWNFRYFYNSRYLP